MRLKQLSLQGYKSFATRTEFLFPTGITAVVGPNGSGKSNLADAVRWVLGEQSLRSLRGKSTEDMIFSGGQRRARAGMAEVLLTLDNSDGWLPIDFSEVTIGRRAYRSGQNEYLINNNRVRLRDVAELLGASGLAQRTYTVVGQGMVDAALSLRPQERRALFEEAAGIALYRSKREETLRRLEETRHNLERVHDIVGEIAPRVGQLKRQAERAAEHQQLSAELQAALQVWYGYRWHKGQNELHGARQAMAARQERANADEQRLVQIENQIADVRQRRAGLRDRLAEWGQQQGRLQRELDRVARELAVAEERQRLLKAQREEIVDEVAALEVSRAEQEGHARDVEALLAAIDGRLRAEEERLAQAQAALDVREAERRALRRQQTAAQERLAQLEARNADRRTRLEQLEERGQQLAREQDEQRRAGAELHERLAAEQGRLAELESAVTLVQGELQALEERRAQAALALGEARRRVAALAQTTNRLVQEEGRLQTRYEMLARMRAEGSGLYAGVRAVLQAGEQGRLQGIVGTVAALIEVPPDLEQALEVVLGGHLQDLVMEDWRAAEAAIDFLKRERAGRATFLPLDTVRASQALAAPQIPGVIGVGSDLVRCEARLRPIAALLLGRTLVVEDLPTARRAFEQLRGGFQIVTRAGELLRSSGAVTGGSDRAAAGQHDAGSRGGQPPRAEGVLGREREYRELPAALDRLVGEREQAAAEQAAAEREIERLEALLETLTARQRQQEGERARRAAAQAQQQQTIAQCGQEIRWREDRLAQLQREAQDLQGRAGQMDDELVQVVTQIQAARAEAETLSVQLESVDTQEPSLALAERRAAVALVAQEHSAQQAVLQNYRANAQQLAHQVQVKRQRAERLGSERETLTVRIVELGGQRDGLRQHEAELEALVRPAEAERVSLNQQQEQLEVSAREMRAHLQQSQQHLRVAQLDVGRREDELRVLQRQIEEDLGLVNLELGQDLSAQNPLPLPDVSTLPPVAELPPNLETELQRLKAQIRRLGPVNFNAPQEYAEVQQRHDFLQEQVSDLSRASAQLQEIVAELDELMRRSFRETFDRVSAEFKHTFAALFNGGSGELVLTEPGDLNETGVDIVVRPPGKRTQGLAMLSGGERALTAAALIFAILRACPTPFCVLDEVDAALDEANVGRFRNLLKAMAHQTQFVVVTHNRGTVEAADTIYGVSMGSEGVSQVMSLRLEGDQIVAQQG